MTEEQDQLKLIMDKLKGQTAFFEMQMEAYIGKEFIIKYPYDIIFKVSEIKTECYVYKNELINLISKEISGKNASVYENVPELKSILNTLEMQMNALVEITKQMCHQRDLLQVLVTILDPKMSERHDQEINEILNPGAEIVQMHTKPLTEI